MVKSLKISVKTKFSSKRKYAQQKATRRYEIQNARNIPFTKIKELTRASTDALEEAYRTQIETEAKSREKVCHLLPIKVKGKGVVNRSTQRHPSNVHNETGDTSNEMNFETNDKETEIELDSLSLAEIILKRKHDIQEKQLLIGSHCAAILENPDARIDNIAVLLDCLRETNKDGSNNFLSIRKIAMISLVEIFRDIVPEYRVGIVDKVQQKLKKDTVARVNYENKLLAFYKQYLQQLETVIKTYHRNKRQSKNVSADTLQLLDTSVNCLCDLVLAHPYFNYTQNIVQVLVPILNDVKPNLRKIVHACFSTLFKTDTRLDLTHHVVRHINLLISKKERNIFPETISCLKYLQINQINLHDDTLLELKKHKLEKQKSRVINMSRKERKRKKKLSELEKDIFETKAEESKQVVRRKLTDISKLTFMIFFKILKCYPDSRVLSVTLEGLSKFAHTISIDFFSDLIELLNTLLENAGLGYREQLHCIQTVFVILTGRGEVLNVDPARFYSHFYKNLLYVNAGRNHQDMETILNTLNIILFKRRCNVTYQRNVSYIKRLATLCLQVLPNGCLGLLALIRSSFKMNQQLDILIDTDASESYGSGMFDPFTDEPQIAHTKCTSLYETTCLARHYHQMVRKVTITLLKGADTVLTGGGMLTPSEFYTNYDCSKMVFNPEITSPFIIKNFKQARSQLGLALIEKQLLTNRCKINFSSQHYAAQAGDNLQFDYFEDYVNDAQL
ncbi:nucleolar complex protein 3 homolog [Anopheles bellator]|uniref:nucleolar complex protein 3 homolog n=1 Tax=Anopheles bellator TaxID=139047 RepID=UPI002647ECF5|nr:nucleolar complex protein 3 homolog [Anopheles bellator]